MRMLSPLPSCYGQQQRQQLVRLSRRPSAILTRASALSNIQGASKLLMQQQHTIGSTIEQKHPQPLVFRVLPPIVRPYAALMRIDKPVGTWLLFWPCGMCVNRDAFFLFFFPTSVNGADNDSNDSMGNFDSCNGEFRAAEPYFGNTCVVWCWRLYHAWSWMYNQ